jgi:hypothetical protein
MFCKVVVMSTSPESKLENNERGSPATPPSISLPKGGGAILGERFAANPVTGNGSLSVPILTSADRTDFGPQLTLACDSGAGSVPFDFGEHDPDKPTPDESTPWPVRLDPFSTYLAGFEMHTYRLCQRVLMFHRFSELSEEPCLVRSTDFTYSYEDDPQDAHSPIFSFLNSDTQSGYKRRVDGSYLGKALPPLEFTYSRPIIQQEVCEVDPESLENLPNGPDGRRYQWVDLDGERLSGILTEQSHKPHLSRDFFSKKQILLFLLTDKGKEK